MRNKAKKVTILVTELNELDNELRRLDGELAALRAENSTMLDFIMSSGLGERFGYFKVAVDKLGVSSSQLARAIVRG